MNWRFPRRKQDPVVDVRVEGMWIAVHDRQVIVYGPSQEVVMADARFNPDTQTLHEFKDGRWWRLTASYNIDRQDGSHTDQYVSPADRGDGLLGSVVRGER